MNAPQFQNPASARQLQRWLLPALLLITLAVFGGVCGHEFVHFDDNVNIYNNPHIKGLTWENLTWMFTNASYARRYMPFGWLAYAIDYQFFGLNPHAYHTGNLFLHLLNVSLVFFLLKRLLLLGHDTADPTSIWCAALGALFWGVNPLRVENVAWASSRIYCLAFCLAALSLLAWLRARDESGAHHRKRRWYWFSVAAFAGSLLTYPLALLMPMAMLVIDACLLRAGESSPAIWKKLRSWPFWRDKLSFAIVATAVLAITCLALVNPEARAQPFTLAEFPVSCRLMQAFYIWAYYLWKPWLPYDLTISYMTLHSFRPFSPPFVLSAGAVVAITLGLFFSRNRRPGAFGLWLCHLVLLVPMLGLTEYPHSPYDRYSYVQGVLWSVALAFWLSRVSSFRNHCYLAWATVASASALFALLAWQQVAVWRGTIPLYENLLARTGDHPDRARFDTVLGTHYLRAGLTNEAIASFKNAIHYEPLRPDRRFFDEGVFPVACTRLGDIYFSQSRFQEAFDQYQAAVRDDPSAISARIKAGATLTQLGREEEAVKWMQECVRLNPSNPEALQALALALRRCGRKGEAAQPVPEYAQ